MKSCAIAPLPPSLAETLARADARAVGLLSSRADLADAFARYEDARAWTWEAIEVGGLVVARDAPSTSATTHDVAAAAAAVLRASPIERPECERCRACSTAAHVAEMVTRYGLAVRRAWDDAGGTWA